MFTIWTALPASSATRGEDMGLLHELERKKPGGKGGKTVQVISIPTEQGSLVHCLISVACSQALQLPLLGDSFYLLIEHRSLFLCRSTATVVAWVVGHHGTSGCGDAGQQVVFSSVAATE